MAQRATQDDTQTSPSTWKLDPVLSAEFPVYRDHAGNVILSEPSMTWDELFTALAEPGVIPDDFMSHLKDNKPEPARDPFA